MLGDAFWATLESRSCVIDTFVFGALGVERSEGKRRKAWALYELESEADTYTLNTSISRLSTLLNSHYAIPKHLF
jgi:hypothetical protein